MSVFVWPTPFRALAKCNQRGIDKDYGPTGHSGCAEKKSGLALAAGTETYILRHSGTRWRTAAYTDTDRHTHGQTHRVRESDLDSINKGIVLSPDICSKCLTQLNPLIDTSNVVGSASTLHPGSSPDGTHPSHCHSLRLNHFLCL